MGTGRLRHKYLMCLIFQALAATGLERMTRCGGKRQENVLPCPSVPYTYVLDGAGRIAVAQAGDVDWLAPQTRATLTALLAEPASPSPPGRPTL